MTEKPRAYVSRFVVKLGKPNGPAYEVEITFPVVPTSEEFEKARKAALHDIQTWLSEKTQLNPLDPAELDKLPWKAYKEGHRAGWVFTNTQGAEALVEAIRQSEAGKVELGEFVYCFSGPKEDRARFISRNPKPTPEPPAPAPSNGAPQP